MLALATPQHRSIYAQKGAITRTHFTVALSWRLPTAVTGKLSVMATAKKEVQRGRDGKDGERGHNRSKSNRSKERNELATTKKGLIP